MARIKNEIAIAKSTQYQWFTGMAVCISFQESITRKNKLSKEVEKVTKFHCAQINIDTKSMLKSKHLPRIW